jgi:hypothetical protein
MQPNSFNRHEALPAASTTLPKVRVPNGERDFDTLHHDIQTENYLILFRF